MGLGGINIRIPLGDGGTLAGGRDHGNILCAIAREILYRPIAFVHQWCFTAMRTDNIAGSFLGDGVTRTTIIVSFALILTILDQRDPICNSPLVPRPNRLLGVYWVYPVWGWRRLQADQRFMDQTNCRIYRQSTNRYPDICARSSVLPCRCITPGRTGGTRHFPCPRLRRFSPADAL